MSRKRKSKYRKIPDGRSAVQKAHMRLPAEARDTIRKGKSHEDSKVAAKRKRRQKAKLDIRRMNIRDDHSSFFCVVSAQGIK